jgi:hypothetical protein
MHLKGSLLCSQDHTTVPYSQPAKSSLHPSNPVKEPLYLPSGFFSSGFQTKNVAQNGLLNGTIIML